MSAIIRRTGFRPPDRVICKPVLKHFPSLVWHTGKGEDFQLGCADSSACVCSGSAHDGGASYIDVNKSEFPLVYDRH